jgi:hypothetical protein
LTARERVEMVLDEDSPFLELLPFAGYGQVSYFTFIRKRDIRILAQECMVLFDSLEELPLILIFEMNIIVSLSG